MKKVLFVALVLFITKGFGQNFSTSNVNLTFKGLSNDYQKYFKENFNLLIETMNKLKGLDKSIAPVTLNIGYEKNEGYIQMIVNYDNQKQVENTPAMIKSQINMAKQMGSNGFSIYLPDLLMLSLNDYKYKVLSSSQFNNEIKKFKIKVNIKKSDDLWIQFYCKEFVDYNGVPRYNFKDTADLKYSVNKKCQVIALNGSKLDEYKIWEFGTSDKPDGTKTCDYYINKFIEVAEKNNNNSKKIIIRLPFKPDGYVNPGTKPIYKDSLITEIIFTSSSAMVGFGLDKTPSTLTLTESTFTFQSGNTNENYSIIDQKYDEEMNMQDFLLADKTGQSKHKVSIAFSKSMNSYLIIFSKNNSDLEYQFQNIEVKSIKRK